jgi:3-dehydroquinate dehydratase / shikimate dehydrogenase
LIFFESSAKISEIFYKIVRVMLFASFANRPALNDLNRLDGVELRLDLFPHWDIPSLRSLMAKISIPIMITLRNGSEQQIHECLQLKPDFFDIDIQEPFPIENYPDTKWIVSYHNFAETPNDLESIYRKLQKRKAFAYKIACFANSTNDALRMLLFSKKHPDLSVICMGEKGEWARILGPVVGNVIDYACVQEKTAPGQLTVSEMLNIYRYRTLNRETHLYGLIGDPVKMSMGHIYHNGRFQTNAVYVKMIVKSEELEEFFPLAEEIGFLGLSVTMPLKTAVIPFVKTECDSVNTIRMQGRVGISTDGIGALDAIGDVNGKVVLVLGAGGAAQSIADVAKKRGAMVWIHNRTPKNLNYRMGVPDHYDIVINCTPQGDESFLRPGVIAMDIVYVPRETNFIKRAKQLGCPVVYGEEMFFNQAAAQREFWGCDRPRDLERAQAPWQSDCRS